MTRPSPASWFTEKDTHGVSAYELVQVQNTESRRLTTQWRSFSHIGQIPYGKIENLNLSNVVALSVFDYKLVQFAYQNDKTKFIQVEDCFKFMSDLHRLFKHFSKPEPEEFVPIEFIELTREMVAWSPKLKHSIYVTPKILEAGEPKRVREVKVVRVVNQLSGSISTVELTDEDKEHFENLYKIYQEKRRKILFSHKKIGRKIESFLTFQRKRGGKNERR